MMTKDEAAVHARRHYSAADALEKYSRAASWAAGLAKSPGKARVSWETGSAITGYAEIQERVSQLITSQLPMLIAKAVDELASDAHVALKMANSPNNVITDCEP